jgi:hypothetical protein
MLDLSLIGLVGAFAGTAPAGVVYGPLVTLVERAFRARSETRTAQAQAAFENEIAALRRAVLALDILLFVGLGYWIGALIEG